MTYIGLVIIMTMLTAILVGALYGCSTTNVRPHTRPDFDPECMGQGDTGEEGA